MKQWLLIIWSILLTGSVSAQEYTYYAVKNEGSRNPIFAVTENNSVINIQLDVESFNTSGVNRNGIEEDKIILGQGISNMEHGVPDIQHLSASVVIPSLGKTILHVISSEYIDYPYFKIAPSTGDPSLNSSTQIIPDTNIFNHNVFWPSALASLDDPYISGNIRGQSLHFYPIQYNPVTQTLRVYHHLEVSIESVNEPGVNELTRYAPEANPLTELQANHFINASLFPVNRYSSVNEKQGRMLIIAHPLFIEAMKPFINWKIQKGIPCELIDVTTLGDANSIRQFVSEYYYNYGLTYLLIAGDENYVPSNQATKGVSDIMYGYISGDDHYPEILVGRFSCETIEQCRIMVERTINYEKNPSAVADFNNLLGIGSGLGPGDDSELDYEHIRNIGNLLNSSIYPDFHELYDGSRGGHDLDGNPTVTNVVDAINQGQGAIMYIGHGSLNSWLTTGFSTTDIKKLENTETHPFIWAAGCNNGLFNGSTCLAEGFQRAHKDGRPTGAIGALMSSASQTWYPPMEAQDEIASLMSTTNSKNITFGGLSFNGCMKMNDKYGKGGYVITDNWIFFGDPSVEIRTSTAKTFTPIHDTLIGIDVTRFSIYSLPSNSFISLSADGKILTSGYSDESITTLNLPQLDNLTQFTLTITGRDYKPYINVVKITLLPAFAVNPVPANNSFKVDNTTDFNWELSSGCNPASFTFCIRENGQKDWQTKEVNTISELNADKLKYLTTYEWKVISHSAYGQSESKIFDFTTIEQPDEDFEQESFSRGNWLNSESWFVDNSAAYEGNFSLHSGSTTSKGSSSLFYECETLTCDYISYWLKLNIQDPSAKLSFYMDDFMVAEWDYTLSWANITYQVEPGYHKFEWRFTNSADSILFTSAAWLDNIYLPVNNLTTVSSLDQTVCTESSIQLQAVAENYASVKWESSGAGFFDDPSRIDAIYYPSVEELSSDLITLNLIVKSNNICSESHYEYSINVEQPAIIDFQDTTIYLTDNIVIDLAQNADFQILRYADGTESSSMDLDLSKMISGENTITIIAQNSNGCAIEKEININLISSARPSVNTLTVYPNPSSESINLIDPSGGELSTVSIYRSDGQLIANYDFSGINKASIQVSHLDPGLYIIKTEDNGIVTTSRFIKI